MTKVLWITTAVLVIHAAHSYILLTANVEELRNVARRMVGSPIRSQVGNIVRKAYKAFNGQLKKVREAMRADDKDDDSGIHLEDDLRFRRKDTDPDTSSQSEEDAPPARTHSKGVSNEKSWSKESKVEKPKKEEFSSLGKSASVYLQKIKKIFQDTEK